MLQTLPQKLHSLLPSLLLTTPFVSREIFPPAPTKPRSREAETSFASPSTARGRRLGNHGNGKRVRARQRRSPHKERWQPKTSLTMPVSVMVTVVPTLLPTPLTHAFAPPPCPSPWPLPTPCLLRGVYPHIYPYKLINVHAILSIWSRFFHLRYSKTYLPSSLSPFLPFP